MTLKFQLTPHYSLYRSDINLKENNSSNVLKYIPELKLTKSESEPDFQKFKIQRPPEYFTHLYRSITDKIGIQVAQAPYFADMVFGFLDYDIHNQSHYIFNITNSPDNVQLCGAEFHIYRRKSLASSTRIRDRNMFIYLTLFLVVESLNGQSWKQLDLRRLPWHYSGWIVFNVKYAAEYWLQHPVNYNKGIILTAQNRYGGAIRLSSGVSFAQRYETDGHLQPCLVFYYRHEIQGVRRAESEGRFYMANDFVQEKSLRYENVYAGRYYVKRSPEENNVKDVDAGAQILRWNERDRYRYRRVTLKRRYRRMTAAPRNRPIRQHCSVHPMVVEFSKIGWNKWIISPSKYDAGLCLGTCPFPLGQGLFPTNHAVLQSIWHQVNRPSTEIPRPCCVPHILKPLSMLYFENENSVVLKPYEGMIVQSCACK